MKAPALFGMLVLLLLSGCGHNPVFSPAVSANEVSAVVHLYRPEATTPGLAKPLRYSHPEILVDGAPVGVVGYNEYLSFTVLPGKHTLRITGLTPNARDWELRDINRPFTAEAGDTLYFRLKVEYNLKEMNLFQPKPSYVYFLTPVSANDAQYEIRHVSPVK